MEKKSSHQHINIIIYEKKLILKFTLNRGTIKSAGSLRVQCNDKEC